MSISGISGLGGIVFLSQLGNTQATDAVNGDGTSTNTSSNSGSSSTNSTDASSTAGSAALSSEILALLIQLQAQSGNATATSPSSSNGTSAVTSATSGTSSTTANPISSFFSSLDTDGNGSISQSEFENFIEKLGGTQNEADTLFSQLTQNNNANGLSEQQLAQDAFGYGPPPPPQQPSASQMANGLINAMGGSNGQVTKSEFEDFVTSNGGTTSEADQDFAALDTSGSSTLSASDLEKAIQNQQQQQASSSTSISPVLTWLNSLSATTSGIPTA